MMKTMIAIMLAVSLCQAIVPSVDIFDMLDTDQKIGQLFAIAVPLSSSRSLLDKLCAIINHYHIGSVLLDKLGTIRQQVMVVNYLQKNCIIPPLILQDFENGPCMRLCDAPRFPKTITCGAIQNDNLIYQMAQEIGRECKLLGVDINLAPVVDIIGNNQCVVKERSYGQNKDNVLRKACAFIQGLLSQRVYPCLKHFPGLGDTVNDPHLELPMLPYDQKILQDRELYPYINLAELTPCIMSAHVSVPAYESKDHYSATFSFAIISQLLKQKLNFNGIVITDALHMQALTSYFDTSTITLESFNAGNDLLLCPEPIQEAFEVIKESVGNGKITLNELDNHVEKILHAKKALGIFNKQCISDDVYQKIYTSEACCLKKELYYAAVTLLRNQANLIPLKQKNNFAYVQIGGASNSVLLAELQKRFPGVSNITLDNKPKSSDITGLLTQLEDIDTVIVALFNVNSNEPLNFGIAPNSQIIIDQLVKIKKVILVICGSPYCLKLFEQVPTIVMAYEDDPDAQEAAAKVITGSLNPSGRLPVQIASFVLGSGISLQGNE